MAKAFWKGVISFGMVVIPIRMYVATETQTLSFHLLHKKCLTRPRQVLFCEQDNEYFSAKETSRGYEYARGQYVVLDESDFEKVPVRTAHAINIVGFAESDQIEPLYYRAAHYLEPEELAAKPFSLLRETLLKTGQVGIAKVTFQRREHLCALRPLGDILALHTLYYHGEILNPAEITPSKPELKKEELEMAMSLVNTMKISFKPEDYKDEYRQALKKLIDARVKGKEIKLLKAPPQEEIGDLMSALRASIEAAKKKSAEKVPVAARPARK